MSQPVQSHAALMALAATGAPFTFDEVFHTSQANRGQDPAQIVGNGYDFDLPVEVPDVVEGKSVTGTASLRVLNMPNTSRGGRPALFLRTWLRWTTSNGNRHTSYASYQITAQDAQSLADSATNAGSGPEHDLDPDNLTPEDLERGIAMLFALMDEATTYNAQWMQTYPGWDGEAEHSLDLSPGAIDAAEEYHPQAIHAAVEGCPDFLCMLSDSDFGTVAPDELDKLLKGITTQFGLIAPTTG